MDWKLPELGEGVYEAELVSWLVSVGDSVKRGQNLMEVLTDKATMEVPSPFAGRITALQAEAGQQVKVGDVVLSYEPTHAGDGDAPPKETEAAAVAAPVRPTNGPVAAGTNVKAAPSVRLMARKLGIDISRVRGSGPDGRVLIEDLGDHVAPAAERREKPAAAGLDLGRAGTRIKLAGVRRKIAEQMVRSKHAIPHYSYVDECDVSELVYLRDSLKETAARKGVKLTYLPFFVKAVVAGLKGRPDRQRRPARRRRGNRPPRPLPHRHRRGHSPRADGTSRA
jgi:pyruvate/2-oxoglutarate dehydrogenase complex dihydrolipoamide acyltransferase (E2) component